jgi:hypothetical protein
MQNLPIGKQTFSAIRDENLLYVDKTKYIHRMITQGSRYFLSRPRRFGKSLTLSTLDAIFSGKRELFDGLAIADTDYNWEHFPVLRFDMSEMAKNTVAALEKSLADKITQFASEHEVAIDPNLSLGQYFSTLIATLSKKYKKKVVVLVDEYDKPIISHLTNIPVAIAIRDTLRSFYTILKAADEHLRFVMLTGVSKFSKAGVFSELNHLTDLTMDTRYAGLCGYTQEELEYYFRDYIEVLAHPPAPSQAGGNLFSERATALSIPSEGQGIGKTATDISVPSQKGVQGTTVGSPLNESSPPPGRGQGEGPSATEQVLTKIKTWYNGYRFSTADLRVYNPFSTLLLFEQREFKPYWFETGTPKFLVDLIKANQYQLENAAGSDVTEAAFATYELENLSMLPLLLQTGYLSINTYDREWASYHLDYPNFEVKHSFLSHILRDYTHEETADTQLRTLIEALQKGQTEVFFETLQIFFAKIPYDIQLKQEKYYQTIFYTLFMLLGLRIHAEVRTNKGRIDAVIETTVYIYIFEFKLHGSAEEAISQIKEGKYYQRYTTPKRVERTESEIQNAFNTGIERVSRAAASPFKKQSPSISSGKRPELILVGVSFDQNTRNIGKWITETTS